MLLPCLQEVEGDRMGVFRCELRVTERHHRGITGITERIQLSSPWTTQTIGIVQLQLCALRQLIIQEQRGEELEEVFLVRCFFRGSTMLLGIVITLCIHLPILPAQSRHYPQLTNLGVDSGIEGMGVHRVDKAVVV